MKKPHEIILTLTVKLELELFNTSYNPHIEFYEENIEY